ncbi:MAG TPA: redoxin domain-containing protein [Pyrinomonadaceae bacterium]|nr:redoxin domain-containing protein [Pyrinomonadaceae bacterium]
MNRLFMFSVALTFPFVGLILTQQPNRSPSIDSFFPSSTAIRICPFHPPTSLSDDPEVALVVNATDPDGDSLRYEYSTTEGTISGRGKSVVWDLRSVPYGPHKVSVTAADGKGGKVEASLTVTTIDSGACDPPPPPCPVIKVSSSVLRQETVAPQFTLKDVNGRTVRLGDYKGKVVVINFWATWCPPCRAEMPELVRLQREHGKEGLQIIGVTYPPENKARVQRFARSLKVNYPIILGTREFKARFSSEETLPLTVVINRDGKVSDIISGILLREEFDEKIKPLLIKEN